MTGREFLNTVANGEIDMLGLFLRLLQETGSEYCVIGGLAVNAYAEPVVSLDLDIVVMVDRIGALKEAAVEAGMKMQTFEHSVNLAVVGSDLRVQLQTDRRYQAFIRRAVKTEVLGYQMFVACIEDVLAGKLWAYSDKTRRGSKRQKDLADIMRMAENHPRLVDALPLSVQRLLE